MRVVALGGLEVRVSDGARGVGDGGGVGNAGGKSYAGGDARARIKTHAESNTGDESYAATDSASPLGVILLHGFGAPGDDLVSLAEMLRAPNARFAFPAAPLQVPGGFGGCAWWMIDIERFAMEAAAGRARDLDAVPPGLAEAREKVTAMVAALEREWRIPQERMLLGGFSQGAMLACDIAARSERNFAGLIILSGGIIAHREWQTHWHARAGMPVFQSHGENDPLLAYATAKKLRNELRAHGLAVEWRGFRGGHEIPGEVLAGVGEFLGKCGGGA